MKSTPLLIILGLLAFAAGTGVVVLYDPLKKFIVGQAPDPSKAGATIPVVAFPESMTGFMKA